MRRALVVERLPEARDEVPDARRDEVPDARRDEVPDARRPLLALLLARRAPPFRNAAGISAFATALVSCGINRWRKLDIRSSCRRIARARLAVCLSPTRSASVSIAV